MLSDFVRFLESSNKDPCLANLNATAVREFIIHEQGRGLSPYTVQGKVSELCNLRFEDAHIEEGYLKVTGKGNKERVVPIGALAQKMLWLYIFYFRPKPLVEPNNYPFLSLDGKGLQPNAIKLLLKRWGKRAGVTRLHNHLCRHTYATNFLLYKCWDVFRLQQILGHATLEMARRYVHYASTETMIRGHLSSPVDQMGLKKLRGYKIDRVLNSNRG